MDNVKKIALVAADDRGKKYGIVLVSDTEHKVNGRGVHNPHHPHKVEVWVNKMRDGKLMDPHGRPTTEQYTALLSAKAVVIAANRPAVRECGVELSIGDVVELSVHDYSIGTFKVTAGRLCDPYLVRMSDKEA